MTASGPTLRQIIVFVLYSVLCLAGSMTVAGYVAPRITRNVSNFEGGAGYAALGWIVISTCTFCGLSIAFRVVLRKRTVVLAVITAGFAVLSVLAFRAIRELATWRVDQRFRKNKKGSILRSSPSNSVGGAEEDRTPDLRIANATLSQLSYRPNSRSSYTRISALGNRGYVTPTRYFDGAPANTHSTTDRASASLMRGCAGIGIAPHTPEPPSFTFFDSLATACGSDL